MAVGCFEVTNSTILKPYSPPSSPPHHHHLPSHQPPPFLANLPKPPPSIPSSATVPLTLFDRAAFDIHVCVLYAFKHPTPTNQAMKDGLAKALTYFPHLSGRLVTDDRNRPSVVLNDAGIRLVEANFPTTLESNLPLEPSDQLERLHPNAFGVEELLQIQLNRFACGGLVIGLTANHRVADGASMSSFLVAWARLVRGLELESLPYHDRAAIFTPREPPRPELDHGNIEFKKIPASPPTDSTVDQVVINYSAEFISKLKNKVTGGDATRRCSTFQALLTHIWKRLTQARGLDSDEPTHVRVAVNGRARMRPAVPMSYFGNLVLWAYPRMKAGEVITKTYTEVSDAIRETVSKIDDSYFKSFVDYGELLRKEGKDDLVLELPEGMTICPNLEVDSWLSFDFHALDFGGGGPCAFLPPSMAVEGLLVFVPSCVKKGGVDVFLGVLHEHSEIFREIAYSLD